MAGTGAEWPPSELPEHTATAAAPLDKKLKSLLAEYKVCYRTWEELVRIGVTTLWEFVSLFVSEAEARAESAATLSFRVDAGENACCVQLLCSIWRPTYSKQPLVLNKTYNINRWW